jgi:hypothetical protein
LEAANAAVYAVRAANRASPGWREAEEVGQTPHVDVVERRAQADFLRDLFGNPFRLPPNIDRAWQAWRDGAVVKLTRTIYDDRAFDRLPILADALEDAGCDNADILAHCRQPGEHVRGCWVIDLLLGKE